MTNFGVKKFFQEKKKGTPMYNDFRKNYPEIYSIMRATYFEESWDDESRPRFMTLHPHRKRSRNSTKRSTRKTLAGKKRHILESECFEIEKAKVLTIRFSGSSELGWKAKIHKVGNLYVFKNHKKRFRENKIEILKWHAVMMFDSGIVNGINGFTANHAMARLAGDFWAIDNALGRGISLYNMHQSIFFAWGDVKRPRNNTLNIVVPNGYKEVW